LPCEKGTFAALSNRSKFAKGKRARKCARKLGEGVNFRAKPTRPPQEAGIAKERLNWQENI